MKCFNVANWVVDSKALFYDDGNNGDVDVLMREVEDQEYAMIQDAIEQTKKEKERSERLAFMEDRGEGTSGSSSELLSSILGLKRYSDIYAYYLIKSCMASRSL